MRIGFDVSQTGRHKAGCGYYAYNLIRALADVDQINEYVLYPAVGDVYWDPECATQTVHIDRPNFRRLAAPQSFEASSKFWRDPPSDFEERIGNPDIFHANNFFCPIGLRRARLVYTLYDLSFLEEPSWTTEANRIGCFTGVFRASLFADAIVAISEFSRRHFLEVFPHYPASRTHVIYPASRFDGPQDLPTPATLRRLEPGRFWLNVATIEPRKNHRGLLEAYARVVRSTEDPMPLVLAGSRGWLTDDFDRIVEELGLGGRVLLLGYVSEDELRWLYQNCFAFVYPSFFEGFGLPVLEAMSLGAPVICSNTTSLPEIAGDAAVLVDPREHEALASRMKDLLQGQIPRDVLRERGFAQARRFSWWTSARRLVQLYQVLGELQVFAASPQGATSHPARFIRP